MVICYVVERSSEGALEWVVRALLGGVCEALPSDH